MFVSGLFGTIIFLTMIYFMSKSEINEVDKFVKKALKNAEILTVTDTQFQTGRGSYKLVTTTDDPNIFYPAMVSGWSSDDLGDNIEVGSKISKDGNSRSFEIQNGDKMYRYELSNPADSMLILMTIVTIMSLGMTTLMTISPTLGQIKVFK